MTQLTLSQQLTALKNKVWDSLYLIEGAVRLQNREQLHRAQAEINAIWPEWDRIIRKVAEAEQVVHNMTEILAASEEE